MSTNEKDLALIPKELTSKVLVTEEGNTPLLKREVLNLYHIYRINRIIKKEKKQEA